MGNIQKINKLDLSKYILYFILAIFSIYIINFKHRENTFTKHIKKQNNEILNLEKHIDNESLLNGILMDNMSYVGSSNAVLNKYINNRDLIKIVAISKYNESVLARSKFLRLLNLLSAELINPNIIYCSDYQPKFSFHLSTFLEFDRNIISIFDKTPILYLINKENIILSRFVIKGEFEEDILSLIKDSVARIYLKIKKECP